MARTKSMRELFQPLKIKFNLKAERPYFEIDGARTYLITEDGKISQNALFALQHGLAEKKKYEQFDKLKKFLVASIHDGVPVQEGELPAEATEKDTHANLHAKLLAKLAGVLYADDEAKIQAVMAKAVEKRKKRTITINGVEM